MVGQRLGGPVFTGGNQVPDEALDILVATVMEQAVREEGSADCFHVCLLHGAFETTVGQDIAPPPPAKDGETDPLAKDRTAKDRTRFPFCNLAIFVDFFALHKLRTSKFRVIGCLNWTE